MAKRQTSKKSEPTNRELFELIQKFQEDISSTVNKFADHVEIEFVDLKGRVTCIEANMVTKDYLDEKLGELQGGLIKTIRKEG